MVPVAHLTGTGDAGFSTGDHNCPEDSSQSGQSEEELCCPNCGLVTSASELPDLLLPQLIE